MKIIICLLYLGLSYICNAQYSTDLRQGNADYPIPYPVAMNSLDDNSPTLLYPSTVRTLAFSLNARNSLINKTTSAGLEFTPFLIGNFINLSDYLSGRLMRVLLRTRISVAADLNGNDGIKSAIGFRWMLHDDADIRSDSSFLISLLVWGFADSLDRQFPNIDRYSEEFYSCMTEGICKRHYIQYRIDSLRQEFKNRMWNKSVFEFAMAINYESEDNSSNNLKVQRYNFYGNYGFPVLGRSGQIVLGASGWIGHNDQFPIYQRRGSFIMQFCYGSVSERLFIETKYTWANKLLPDFRPAIGAMINISNGIWLQSAVGFSMLKRNWIGSETYIRINFGTPEINL